MDDDLKNFGVWVNDEQVGFCLNKREADELADILENNNLKEDVTVEIDQHLFKR
jgi:hypothetical protein